MNRFVSQSFEQEPICTESTDTEPTAHSLVEDHIDWETDRDPSIVFSVLQTHEIVSVNGASSRRLIECKLQIQIDSEVLNSPFYSQKTEERKKKLDANAHRAGISRRVQFENYCVYCAIITCNHWCRETEPQININNSMLKYFAAEHIGPSAHNAHTLSSARSIEPTIFCLWKLWNSFKSLRLILFFICFVHHAEACSHSTTHPFVFIKRKS